MFTYALINLMTIFFPLVLSFDRKVRFVRYWKYALPAILLSAVIFIGQDVIFTRNGVWGFSPQYLTGRYWLLLPMEEIMFFICVPFAGIFVYEVVRAYPRLQFSRSLGSWLHPLFLIVSLLAVIMAGSRIYTLSTAAGLLVLLGFHSVRPQGRYLDDFYLAYLYLLIPFCVVNGILTSGLGFIASDPVVWYNNTENLSWRIGSIPVEDFFYWLLLFLLNITLYEWFKTFSHTDEDH